MAGDAPTRPGFELATFLSHVQPSNRYATKPSVLNKHSLYPVYTIEQTSSRRRASSEETSSWLVQLTYSSSSSQLVEPAWSCKRGVKHSLHEAIIKQTSSKHRAVIYVSWTSQLVEPSSSCKRGITKQLSTIFDAYSYAASVVRLSSVCRSSVRLSVADVLWLNGAR